MKDPSVLSLTRSDPSWPRQLDSRAGNDSPSRLWGIGNPEVLGGHKVSLFCSVRCPGSAIIAAHDAARKLRDDGVTVISGFQSPVEKECLRILLRGKQPIIICLARSLERLRLRAEWRNGLDSGRLLILSPFEKRPRRPDIESARRRNELVAALSDDVLIIYATPGGQIEQISRLAESWRLPHRHI